MIAPDDPRHGLPRGYFAGCREACCRKARSRYEKGSRLDRLSGRGRAIPALGYQRRIQALARMGWSFQDIADEAGWGHRNRVRYIVVGQKGKPTRYLERATARVIGEVFERLCMKVPDGPYAGRTRAWAEGKGWAPPLAWDDIDDPNARPHGTAHKRHLTDLDPVAVERAMAGDRIDLTKAERLEVVARLRAMGRSHGWIEQHTVITKPERYIVREAS